MGEWLKDISPKFLKRLSEGSLKNFPKNSAGRSHAILGALSKLDEFLLSPQVRTCSVAVLGTSMKSGSENREPTGDRSKGNPCPEAMLSACHSSNLKLQSRKRFITIITERDFISEYLFPMCSVATNLVMSQEFNPFDSVTTLFYFERTRNGYAANHFILLSSTAESSGTSNYVVVPERFGQNAEPASRLEERTRKKPSFVPSNRFKQCNM